VQAFHLSSHQGDVTLQEAKGKMTNAQMGQAAMHPLRTKTDSATFIFGGGMRLRLSLSVESIAVIAFFLFPSLAATGQTSTYRRA